MLAKKTITQDINKKTSSWLLYSTLLTVFAFITSLPWQSVSGLIILMLAFGLACFYFEEKMLLFFLITRPTLDYWRDIVLARHENLIINVTTVIGILFFVWGIAMLTKHYQQITKTPLWIIGGITSLLFGTSFIYSISPLTSLTEALKFLNVIIIFALSFIFVKNYIISGKLILKAIVFSAILPVFFALFQFITNQGLTTFTVRDRIFGTLAHPNVFAFFVLILIMTHIQYSYITPFRWWHNKERLKHLTTGLGFLLLLFTYTRAAWIGLIVFLLVTGFIYSKKIIYWLVSILIAVYIIVSPLNHWLWQKTNFNLESFSIVARLVGENDEADSVAWREALARESWPLIQSRPWFGYGYGTFPAVWSDNRPINRIWDDSAEAHNDYLRLLLETGGVGLFAYITLLIGLLYKSFKTQINKHFTEHIFLIGSVAVFVVVSLSDNMLHHTPVMWCLWALWGTSLANPHLQDRTQINLL